MTTAVVAASYGGPEVLETREVDAPSPGSGEVTVEVRASGINPVDYKLFSGDMGDDPSALPLRVGLEAAGVVTAVGAQAQGPAGPVAVGDEVIAYPVSGAYAGAITVAASSVFPKPTSLSWEEAAGLSLTGTTAYHLLETTAVTAGDTVLVHAASGGVGLAAAQLAVERGATVVGTAGPQRQQMLRDYGVIPVEYGDGLIDRVRAVAPDGVDVALDAIGSDEAVDTSLALVADRQRIATVAAFERGSSEGIQVLGNGPGADPGTEIRGRGRLELSRLIEDGSYQVVVAGSFPLTEVRQAIELVADGHAGGKVVLLP